MPRFRDWIDEAWALVKPDLWLLVLASVIAGIVGGSVYGVLWGPAQVALSYIIIKKINWPQSRVDIGDFSRGFHQTVLVPAIVAGLIAVWLPSLGMIVLCIGYLFTYPLFILVPLFVMDRRLEGWDACQASIDVVKRHYWSFVGWYTVAMACTFAGALLLYIPGLIVSTVYSVVVVLAYRDLVGFAYAGFPELNPQAPPPAPVALDLPPAPGAPPRTPRVEAPPPPLPGEPREPSP